MVKSTNGIKITETVSLKKQMWNLYKDVGSKHSEAMG